MFQGFTDRTFEFFMAIKFNNNRQFFHENHAWYEEALRNPLRDLAADLAPVIETMDPALETRPEKVVSRINRDIRFSNDKSPYRDYMWLAFRRPGDQRSFVHGIGRNFPQQLTRLRQHPGYQFQPRLDIAHIPPPALADALPGQQQAHASPQRQRR